MRGYLIRHARTSWNEANRLQGQADLPLSVGGRAQASCVGRHFAGRRIAALYTSPLARSRQTAEAIARETLATPIIEPALAEIHLGAWEGLTGDEVDSRYDGAFQRWRLRPSHVQIPHGEPLDAFRARARDVFARIAANHRYGAPRASPGSLVARLRSASYGEASASSRGDIAPKQAFHLPPLLRRNEAAASQRRARPWPGFPAEADGAPSASSAEADEGEVVIVSHGGVIAAWLADWLKADYDHVMQRLVLDNAGISAVDLHTLPPQVLWVNATTHLAQAASARRAAKITA